MDMFSGWAKLTRPATEKRSSTANEAGGVNWAAMVSAGEMGWERARERERCAKS
jgi:hypothetical protein